MTVNNFAKKLGFKNGKAYGFKGHLHILERAGAVEVKQAGFEADSLHHPKIVIIKNLETIEWHFKRHGLFQRKTAPRWKRTKKCKHKDFSIVAVIKEVAVMNKRIRTLILKCGFCEFYLSGIEIDGVMKEARPLT